MPSLEDILKKTKLKSEQVKPTRKPPSIATEDRPYSFSSSSNEAKHKSDINQTRAISAEKKVQPMPDANTAYEVKAELNETKHIVDTNLTQIIGEEQHLSTHKPNTNLTHEMGPELNITKHKADTNLTQKINAKPNSNQDNFTGIEYHKNVSPNKTKHKVNTSQTQIVSEKQLSTHKPNTNLTHERDAELTVTKHKADTNLTQKINAKPSSSQDNPTGVEYHKDINPNETKHKVNTNRTQSINESLEADKSSNSIITGHKPDTNLTQIKHITELVGIQRRLLLFIFDECKKSSLHITEPLTVTHLANSLKIPQGSVKTSIVRLCEKEFISIKHFKNGRGGWSIYEVHKDIYNELQELETQHKLNTNLTQN